MMELCFKYLSVSPETTDFFTEESLLAYKICRYARPYQDRSERSIISQAIIYSSVTLTLPAKVIPQVCLRILVDVIHELINISGSLGLTRSLIHLLFACLAQSSFPGYHPVC